MIELMFALISGQASENAPSATHEDHTPAFTYAVAYTGDVSSIRLGSSERTGNYLDNFLVDADVDLGLLGIWQGARLHGSVLANHGARPNDFAGTLQGIDNIEVAEPGVRLFELWIEKDIGETGGSVLAGLYDVNSEFYSTDASALLIGPAFGIGSELSATGPNGPSIFPSTALAVRMRFGDEAGPQMKLAAVNAGASALGDPGGIDTGFDHGVLLIGEAGWTGPFRVAGGVWRYSEEQPDIRELTSTGAPVDRVAQGAYVLAEGPVYDDGRGREASLFLRAGLSDGDTTDFRGGWQAGISVRGISPSRPDGEFAIGLQQGLLSSSVRTNLRDAGVDPATAEQGLEITYSDKFGPVQIQPDVQIIQGAGGDRSAETVVVTSLRFSISLP